MYFIVTEKGLSGPGLEPSTFQPKGQSVTSGPRRHIGALMLDLSLALRILVRLVVLSFIVVYSSPWRPEGPMEIYSSARVDSGGLRINLIQ